MTNLEEHITWLYVPPTDSWVVSLRVAFSGKTKEEAKKRLLNFIKGVEKND